MKLLGKRAAALGLFVLLAGLPCAHLAAASPSLEEDYRVENYTSDSGLPGNSITSIKQTPDGYLWLASNNGLARFDGVQFRRFNNASTPELTSNSIESMNTDQHGRMWICMKGRKVTLLENGHFRILSGNFGLPVDACCFDGESPDGRVLIDTAHWFQNGRFIEDSDPKTKPQGPGKSLPARMAADHAGHLWGEIQSRWVRMFWWDLSGFIPRTSEKTNPVVSVCPSRQGDFWAGAINGLYLRGQGRWLKSFPHAEAIPDITLMVEDSQGEVWIGTWAHGLYRVDQAGVFHNYPLTRGKQPESVRSLFVDREGTLWLGTEGSGLFRIKRRLIHTFTAENGLSGEVIRSVSSGPDGLIWTINQAGVDRLETAKSGAAYIQHMDEVHLGRCVLADRQGRVWAGAFTGRVTVREGGITTPCEPLDSARVHGITMFFQDRQDQVWVGTTDGLWNVRQGRLQLAQGPSGKKPLEIRAMAEDRDGRLYLGLDDGLWRREEAQWIRMTPPRGVSDFQVQALAMDREDTLWIGTSGQGLVRLKKGTLSQFPSGGTGLPADIGVLIEDDLQSLWLGSDHGLFRIPLLDLNRFAEGLADSVTPIRYSKTDGLESSEMTAGRQPATCKTPDGRVWFATVKGLSVADPRDFRFNSLAPPVLIEGIEVEGPGSRSGSLDSKPGAKELTKGLPVVVPPGNQRIEIHYTATSLAAPERVQFRYRLEGVDGSWTEAGSRRVAYYQGLAPGTYQFSVIACNSDGIWNQAGAQAVFQVQAWYWETVWFKGVAVAAFASAGWLVYRWRIRQIEAVTRLRMRMAGDLHDEIGANLGSIGLNAELLLEAGTPTVTQRDELLGIRQLTAETSQAVRDMVWFVNPDFDNTGGMVQRMREVATLMLAGRKWTLQAPNLDPARPLEIEFRRHVFFIFKEALHNIVKHSGANEVGIEVRIHTDELEMTIADNGRGFDSRQPGSGSGRRNLHSRAKALGGTLEVQAAPEAGTKIRLRAPLRRGRRWPWEKRVTPEKS